MNKFTLSMVAVMAMSTLAMAESYDAYGPNSYAAKHNEGTYAKNNQGATSLEDTTYDSVNRQGFRLGFGIGAANTTIDDYFYNDNLSSTGFATSFEIGYAPTNQLSINYFNNVNFGSSDDQVSGITALTVNYYINNTPDTMYIVAGIGGSVYDDYNSEVEGAGIIGIGYAMDNIEFEIDAVLSKHHNDDMRQFFFTVSYMFY